MRSMDDVTVGVTELERLEASIDALKQAVTAARAAWAREPADVNFRDIERTVLDHTARVSADAIAASLAAGEPSEPEVELDGRVYRRMPQASNGVYFGLHGKVRVRRHLYRQVGVRNGPTIVPLELRAGIVDGRWTPCAAEAAACLAQAVPSREAAETATSLRVLPYSRSSLYRCGEHLGERWEAIGDEAEQRLVESMPLDDEAASVSVSVDRVSIPMEEPASDEAQERTDQQIEVAWRMAYCGVLTLHDEGGKALTSIRYGRMPDGGRDILEDSLEADLVEVLQRRPDLRVVGLADGAAEMQQMLDRILDGHDPEAVAIDFWHLTEKLGKAIVAAGRSAAANLPAWKAQLLSDDRAIERIETWLRTWALEFTGDVPDALYDALTYIDNNRRRLRYASLVEAGLPIGSGMVEATCKTLVAVRMKRSGCRWKEPSGQALLNLRSLACSSRWSQAMTHLMDNYVHQLTPVRTAA